MSSSEAKEGNHFFVVWGKSEKGVQDDRSVEHNKNGRSKRIRVYLQRRCAWVLNPKKGELPKQASSAIPTAHG